MKPSRRRMTSSSPPALCRILRHYPAAVNLGADPLGDGVAGGELLDGSRPLATVRERVSSWTISPCRVGLHPLGNRLAWGLSQRPLGSWTLWTVETFGPACHLEKFVA